MEETHPDIQPPSEKDRFIVGQRSVGSQDDSQSRIYDPQAGTGSLQRIGLGFVWVLAISCLGAGAGLMSQQIAADNDPETENAAENGNGSTALQGQSGQAIATVVPLIASALVTVCHESLGYIHTTTLRWALFRENRLRYNTSLRLLTSSRTSWPNHGVVNIFFLIMLVLSYASLGQLFEASVKTDSETGDTTTTMEVSFVALTVLGASLLLQAMITTWAWFSMGNEALSWSPNPLNNALVCYRHGLERVPGRSMVPYSGASTKSPTGQPVRPLTKQRSLYQTRRSARWVVFFLWAMCLGTLVWAGIIQSIGNQYLDAYVGASALHSGQSFLILNWGVHVSDDRSYEMSTPTAQRAIGVGVASALQVYITFGLHCAELLVNASRDEKEWRAASVPSRGARTKQSGLSGAVRSWETMTLSASKTLLHWGFGQAVGITTVSKSSLTFYANSLFLLSGLLALVAIFGTFLILRQPPGPQPAAWGHFQTLVNLIDDWGKKDEPIFWGDKGMADGKDEPDIRHAGTVGRAELAQPIHPDASYL